MFIHYDVGVTIENDLVIFFLSYIGNRLVPTVKRKYYGLYLIVDANKNKRDIPPKSLKLAKLI